MKKIFSVSLSLIIMLSLLSAAVSALSFNPNEHCDFEVSLKKANSGDVIKDGVIGENEYVKVDIGGNTDEDTLINLGYCDSLHYPMAQEILETAKFYVSWDEVHGFNFAMKFKPCEGHFEMNSDEGTGNPRQDTWLSQLGFQVAADPDVERDFKVTTMPYFYYAVGRRTDNGAYITGDYNQLGPTGQYAPVAGEDFCIEYSGGFATCEWSIPFASFTTSVSGAGDTFYFSMAICNGDAPANITVEEVDQHAASVSLGDYGYDITQKPGATHVTYVLTDEMIAGNNQGGGNSETGGNGGGTQVVTEIETVLTTDEEGNTVVETRVVPKNVPASDSNKTNTGKRTGDPMIIIAAVSAISACGIVVFKKKH